MGPTIKARAVHWLSSKFDVKGKSIYASKFYEPEHSRTGESAWWLEIPKSIINLPRSTEIHLVCETAPDADDFYHLKVPVEFLQKNLLNFDIRENGRISLFLSAESDDMFVDRRGRGNIAFADFLVS